MVSDIITELGKSFPHVIGKILSYLEPEELCVLSCVSQNTRGIIVNDPNARRRRELHLKALQELKQEVGHENWPIKKTTPEVKSENRIALNEVKNTQSTVNRNEIAATEVESSYIRVDNNASANVSISSNVNSTINSTVNTTLNTTVSLSANTTASTTNNSTINTPSNTTADSTSSSTAIQATPEGRRVKRRRVDFSGNVFHIISSTPIINQCRRGSTENVVEQDSGYFEETKNKVKTRSRKCEPTAGSKASKRQLKRL